MFKIPRPSQDALRLLVLYALDRFDIELGDMQLLRCFVELDVMTYFELMQTLSLLSDDKMTDERINSIGRYYRITQKGRDIVHEFEKDIRYSQREAIGEYAEAHRKEMRKERDLVGEVLKLDDCDYRVTLRMLEDHVSVFELHLKYPTREKAYAALENWRANADAIYLYSVNALKNKEQ